MGSGRKIEEKRSVRPKCRWVDNRINGYNNYIMSKKVVLEDAQNTFTVSDIFSFHSLNLIGSIH